MRPRKAKHQKRSGLLAAARNGSEVELLTQQPASVPGHDDAKETLHESEKRYRVLFDLVPAAVYTCDANGLILDFNRRAAALWGRKPRIQDPSDKYCGSFKIFYPDGRRMLHRECPMARVLRGETVLENEREILVERGDGTRRTVAVNPMAIKNAQRRITGAINCMHDITDRKRSEEALKLAGRLPAENPSPVIRLSEGRIVSFANPAARRLLESFGVKVGDAAPAKIARLGVARRRSDTELDLLGRTYLVSAMPVPQGDHVNLYFSDITERKEAEESLAEAVRQQSVLYEFVRRRHDAKTLAEIYAIAIETVLTTLHCDRASILLSDDKGVMRFVAWRRLSSAYRRKVEGHSPWKPKARRPKPICIENINRANFPPSLKATILTEGIHACAFIPLISEGKLIGKFMAYYDQPHVFSNEELTLSLNIGGQLTLAVERKRAEAALLESEELHRAFFSQMDVGMGRTDLRGRLVAVNKKLCEITGYSEHELLGRTISDLTYQDDQRATKRLFQHLVKKGATYHLEKRYLRKDGSLLWVSVTASPICDAKGRTRAAIAVIRDISDRKEAQAALESTKDLLERRVQERTQELVVTNEQLRKEISRRKGLEGEILEISEREKRQIGQELHDSVCQHLTAIAFMARSMANRMKSHKAVEAADVERIAELINEGVTEARTIARGLHPVEMNPSGFAAALQSLLQQRSQLPYRLDIDDEVSIPDPSVALHLYRIASEAVINANKHARARELTVRMRGSQTKIELSVSDDGIGIDRNQTHGMGMGFHVMEYRARSIGARLEITGTKPHGTCVRVICPADENQS